MEVRAAFSFRPPNRDVNLTASQDGFGGSCLLISAFSFGSIISVVVTQMSDERVDLLQSFRVFIKAAEDGAAIPPVEESDLKALHELCVERAKRYCGKNGVISIDLMVHACSPGANLPAVWLRHSQLRALYRQGLLAEWQHGTTLDDAVFQLAATIPMSGTQLDEEAFLRLLRSVTAK